MSIKINSVKVLTVKTVEHPGFTEDIRRLELRVALPDFGTPIFANVYCFWNGCELSDVASSASLLPEEIEEIKELLLSRSDS